MKPRFRMSPDIQAWVEINCQEDYRLLIPTAAYKPMGAYLLFLRGLVEWRA